MPKVSIIVPIYNEEERIQRCVDQLILQTLEEIELVLIDDGSTDQTLSILKEYAQKYPHKISLYAHSNHGRGYTRNRGIQVAKSAYIMFVDADDYISPTTAAEFHEKAIATDADIVIGNIIKVINGKESIYPNYENFGKTPNLNYMVSHSGPVSRLYRRSLFIDHNLKFLETGIYEDLAVVPLVGIYANKIEILEKAYYYYIVRTDSAMQQETYQTRLEDIFIVMEHLTKEWKKRDADHYQEELEYLYIEHLLYSASLRFLPFKEGMPYLKKIITTMKENYPHFSKNYYFKKKIFKFRLVCFLIYYHQFKLTKSLLTMRKGR